MSPIPLLHFLIPRDSLATGVELSSQWSNPADILSLLLIVGSNVVQSALAQLSDGLITPVCFSFGWVAYSFITLAAMAGTGRLMPDVDFPCKVINLQNGYARENRSWVVGRVLRDATEMLGDEGMCVKVLEAREAKEGAAGLGQKDVIWWASLGTMIVQLGVAAVPWSVDNDWGVLMITAIGTLLALLTGSLPQWKVEKSAGRKNSKKWIAVTVGNGSRQILVFKGNGKSMDLEDLASGQGPKCARSWSDSRWFTRAIAKVAPDGKLQVEEEKRKTVTFNRLPLGFWFTRFACSGLTLCWIALLISTSGMKANTWFLIIIGAIGMLQNSIVAAISRTPQTRGLHFDEVLNMRLHKTMDALMDLEVMMPGKVRVLLKEFFPGHLLPDEQAWWAGQWEAYDSRRYRERGKRGIPASMQDERPAHACPSDCPHGNALGDSTKKTAS